MFAIGIDLGGTIIKVGLAEGYTIKKIIRIPTPVAGEINAVIAILEEAIDSLLEYGNVPSGQFKGISIAFAGQVDVKTRKVLAVNGKYEGADKFDFRRWVKGRWNADLFIDNDARMSAIGEWKYGAGCGYDNIVTMTIGTGIGSAVISEGKILRGRHSQFGSLGGHFIVNYNGNECSCGNVGCAEAEAGSRKLPEIVRTHPDFAGSQLAKTEHIDFKSVFSLYDKDKVAHDSCIHCIRVWSTAIVTYIHAYDPDIVILCGGVMKSAGIIIPNIQEFVNSHAWTPCHKVKIQRSALGDDSGIIGAIACLYDKSLQ